MEQGTNRPSRDELLAMAYVDGELPDAERAAFELRLVDEPGLAREVRDLRALMVLARSAAPSEPQDAEWDRLERDLLQRLLSRGGFTLFGLGAIAAVVDLLGASFRSDTVVSAATPICTVCIVAGGVALLAAALRWRARTQPHDPYLDVKR